MCVHRQATTLQNVPREGEGVVRIGVNCCGLVSHSGGVKQYFARLMNRLLCDPREECVLFHRAENIPTLEDLLVPHWRRHAVQLTAPGDLGPLIRSLNVYFCPAGLLSPRPVPVPSVVTLVDIQEVFFPHFFTPWEQWSRLYHHAASSRLANRVVTISEYSKRSITTVHGIADSKVAVAYPAADEDSEGATAGTPPLPTSLPERFLLYPANYWLHKNHDRLLQALALARERHGVTLPCVLTGMEVPHGYDPAAGIARYRLGGSVRVLGYQTKAVMARLYQRATILVFPSLFEGFGLPLVEAMAAGCPIACSRSTSLPEVAGDAAAYFNPAEPSDIATVLMTLWSNSQLRDELIRHGKVRAQRFSVDAMVRAHRDVFEAARSDFADRGPQHESPALRLAHLVASGVQALSSRLLPRTPEL